VATVVCVLVLVALWMRRTQPIELDVEETRTIDRGTDADAPLPRRRRFGRWAEPRTAVEAYIALVEDLARQDGVRRELAETPAAHAARLRAAGAASALSLDLLAADYALVQYGEIPLRASEHKRAVARWRRLRRSLPYGSRRAPGAAADDAI